MPIIYTYPTVTPTANDLILLTDTSDSQKATKTATIANVIGLGTDEVYDLQKTLDNGTISTGSVAVVASIAPAIDVTVTGATYLKLATTAETSPIQLHTTHSDIELSTNGVGEVKLLAGGTGDITFNGTSAVRTKKVILTSADIKALDNGSGSPVPIELIAAPGAGKTIQVLSVYGFLDYSTAQFNAVHLQVRYETAGVKFLGQFATTFANTATDKGAAWGETDGTWIENKKVELAASGNIGGALSNSTLTIYITYIIIST